VPDIEPALLRIVAQRYAAELLVELADRPGTGAQLRGRVCAPRRAVADALRGLGGLGAVRRRDHGGTWDIVAPDSVSYELTPQGADWADQLGRYAVWVAIFERLLDEQDSAEK
jgi:DNA-binding HxlR family transcriptional regulator